MLKRNSLTSNVHSNTTALTANFSLVKGENRLAVYCIDDFGKVWNVLAKRPLLPSIPYRRGLFWLNSPDIYGILFMKTFYNVVNSIICCAKECTCFDRLEYWVSAICLEKLCKTAFCPRSVDKRQRFHVYLGCDVQKVQKAAFFSRHQICWQDFVRVNLSNTKIRPDYLFCLPF